MTPRKPKPLDGRVALVIDANSSSRLITGRMLVEQGCRKVHEARDVRDASELLAILGGKLNFIVVAVDLPKINGLGFVKLLRTGKIKGVHTLPCLLFHAAADERLQEIAAQLDVAAVFVPPISSQGLGRLAAATLARPALTRACETYAGVGIQWTPDMGGEMGGSPAPVAEPAPPPAPAAKAEPEAEPAIEEEMWIADALHGDYVLARSLRNRDGSILMAVGDVITADIVSDLMRRGALVPSSRLYVFKQPRRQNASGRSASAA